MRNTGRPRMTGMKLLLFMVVDEYLVNTKYKHAMEFLVSVIRCTNSATCNGTNCGNMFSTECEIDDALTRTIVLWNKA